MNITERQEKVTRISFHCPRCGQELRAWVHIIGVTYQVGYVTPELHVTPVGHECLQDTA